VCNKNWLRGQDLFKTLRLKSGFDASHGQNLPKNLKTTFGFTLSVVKPLETPNTAGIFQFKVRHSNLYDGSDETHPLLSLRRRPTVGPAFQYRLLSDTGLFGGVHFYRAKSADLIRRLGKLNGQIIVFIIQTGRHLTHHRPIMSNQCALHPALIRKTKRVNDGAAQMFAIRQQCQDWSHPLPKAALAWPTCGSIKPAKKRRGQMVNQPVFTLKLFGK